MNKIGLFGLSKSTLKIVLFFHFHKCRHVFTKAACHLEPLVPTPFMLRSLKNQSLQSKENKLVIKSKVTM